MSKILFMSTESEDVASSEALVDPYSKLKSIRTVEFRQALRGYNIDDVDEYLEQVAVEVDTAFEQIRQLSDQLNQANARAAQLESHTISQVQQASANVAAAAADVANGEVLESLQRTLLMAQKFVDQAHAEAQEQSRSTVAAAEQQAHNTVTSAEQRAREMLANAESEAKKIIAETEGRMKSEVARLEQVRARLAGEVEMVARYLDGERGRLRGVLTEMIAWVDEKFNPAAAMLSSGDRLEEPRVSQGGETGYDTTQVLPSSGINGQSGNGDSGNSDPPDKGNSVAGTGSNAKDEQHGYGGNNISNGHNYGAFSQNNGNVSASSDLEDPLNLFS